MLGWLLYKYLVDMFSSVEDSRLKYTCSEVQGPDRSTAQAQ